ncbi:MAG TPA: NADH-quinone oxidoreductase subunit L [Planctomycetota bacterium]|nr:NADH-quinone oxidoreductase subunit L [Planctomycetota bacterium]
MQNLNGFLIFIPLLPLIGFLILGLGQHRISRSGAGLIASSFAFLSFCLAMIMFINQVKEFNNYLAALENFQHAPGTTSLTQTIAKWITFTQPTDAASLRYGAVQGLNVEFGLTVDRLSSLMLLIVTGIGTLIHIYSIGYMAHDRSPSRFFAYLNLFLAMMLTLVMADNLVLMFVGWEGVGLCSYLLIGFWYEDPEKAKAGRKAFVVNRIGDVGFLLGICIFLFTGVGLKFGANLSLPDSANQLVNLPTWVQGFYVPGLQMAPAGSAAVGVQNLMVIGLICLFIGAIGKSAQIPLFVWLPDAMAGPTPVSALIHAATMVTAGVYMVIRLQPLFGAEWAEPVRVIIATVGIATAVVAGAIAITQTDIKKVLAYSTVSQLGYMVLALGAGAFDAAFFHLLTHAFFKALLFLGAGSVIHGMSEEQDMRKMGGLRKKMPITFYTMAIGAAGLAGIPLLCGFFSKDEILWRTLEQGLLGHKLFIAYYILGVLTAMMTAFYSYRMIALTFLGTSRAEPEVEHHIHESPSSMTIPLVVLAVGTVFAGLLNLPGNINSLFHHEQQGERFYEKGAISRYLMTDDRIHTILVDDIKRATVGSHGPEPTSLHEKHVENAETYEWGGMIGSGLLALIMAFAAVKLYAKGPAWGEGMAKNPVIKPFYKLSAGKFFFDDVFDSLVIFIKVLSFLSWLIVDYILIDSLIVDGLGTLAHAVGDNFRRIQTGVVNSYLLLMAIGAAGILCYFALHLWM